MIQARANINYQDTSFGDMNTAAHKAVAGRHFDVFNLLVKHSADLSIRNKDGLTPLELKTLIDSEVVNQEDLSTVGETTTKEPIESTAMVFSLISCSFCSTENFSLSRTKQGKLVCDTCLKRNPSFKWK